MRSSRRSPRVRVRPPFDVEEIRPAIISLGGRLAKTLVRISPPQSPDSDLPTTERSGDDMNSTGYPHYDRALLYRILASQEELLGMAQDNATTVAALSTQGVLELSALTDLQAAETANAQAVSDLGASVTTLATDVTAGIALIQQLQTGTVAAADVQAVIDQMTASSAAAAAAKAAADASAAALTTAVAPVVVTPPPPVVAGP